MKRLFTLLLISFAALSCEMIDEKLDDLLDKRDWVVFAEGTELSVDVPSKQTVLNYKFESTLDWEVKTEAEWLEIDPMSGKAGKDIKIQIKVAKNNDKEGRTGYVDLTLSNDESYRITINQAGEGDENDENEGVIVDIPNNQIWYTSLNGEVVEQYDPMAFNASIISNTYTDNKGVIVFDRYVTIIGDYAFADCWRLTSVTIPDSVTTIGDHAFLGCNSLTSVTIPDSVTTIGDYAFYDCDKLTSVTISDSVTTIGAQAFEGCSSLQEFNGKFVSEDGRCVVIDGELCAFAPAGITEYILPENVTIIGASVFSSCNNLTSVTIPDSVTTIGDYAFYDCSSLTSVTIPDSVTEIGERAFGDCSSLTSITIGNSVTTIGDGAFDCCSSLTSITIPDSVTTIGYEAFSSCSSLTSVTIGDSVTTIEDYAFSGCSSLTSVTIGNGVTEIGYGTFADCNSLTSITIPDSVTTIGGPAFSNCSSLRSITIGNSVTTIGDAAFACCSSLTSITIPDSVTTIGYDAFRYCSSLTSVYCKPVTPPAGDDYMFSDNASGRKIYVPMESVEAYKSAKGWSEYADAIVGYNF